ncbi:1-phosphofructokinase [Gandjariella thermophila]|uniref:1-phosphofructokinase n=1 Tax=Gandjariella thermophila TaxID=1931992 RepID=A0A4D4JG35_9PSEU|nr:1-phosphofructokinase [Gandjariella thermophila]GDY33289.1 1-phosphofructokinase [Gandjariella thermophila]
MIVTVTPNPSLDRTAVLDELVPGAVLRAERVHVDPGGKGVNVARVLAAADRHTTALLPCGGVAGGQLAELLAPEGVPVVVVPISRSTRSNLTIVDRHGVTTKINEPGPELAPAELEAVRQRVAELAERAEWVVCCGSLPLDAPDDLHAQFVEVGRKAGARVAVDTSGPALAAACAATPELVKPNLAELTELAGRPLPRLGDVLAAARELRDAGVGAVLTSLGRDGALLVDHTGAWHAMGPEVPVASTVGAGDAALAGFLLAGASGPTALRTGVAYGTAAVRLPGSRMPRRDEVDVAAVRLIEPNESLILTGVDP